MGQTGITSFMCFNDGELVYRDNATKIRYQQSFKYMKGTQTHVFLSGSAFLLTLSKYASTVKEEKYLIQLERRGNETVLEHKMKLPIFVHILNCY